MATSFTVTTGPNINSRPISVRASTATQTATSSSLYQVLGIQTGATCKEIKAAYRKLARVLHPDANCNSSNNYEFIKLHEAYETLSDPEKRADYDRSLFRPHFVMSGVTGSPSGFSGYSSRRWETDQCW